VSEAVLRIFGDGKGLHLTGLDWMDEGQSMLVSYSQLGSKMLCTNHNSGLSELDTEAARMVRRLVDIHTHLRLVKRRKPLAEVTLDGTLIERWMLKCMCGLIASRQVQSPAAEAKGWRPPPAWLATIYDGVPMTAPCGVYMPNLVLPEGQIIPRFSVTPYGNTGGSTFGLEATWMDKRFILTTVDPDPGPGSLLDGAAYRPVALWDLNGINSAVTNLSWDPEWVGPTVRIKHQNPRSHDRRIASDGPAPPAEATQ
jgi:hypothetical protein